MSVYAYQVIEEFIAHPEAGSYNAYGICAYREINGSLVKAVYVADAFLKQSQAERLTALCNDLQLDPIHLQDVIEDALAGGEQHL